MSKKSGMHSLGALLLEDKILKNEVKQPEDVLEPPAAKRSRTSSPLPDNSNSSDVWAQLAL